MSLDEPSETSTGLGDTGKDIFPYQLLMKTKMDDGVYRKLRSVLTSAHSLPPWTAHVQSLSDKRIQDIKDLTMNFLSYISGGEPTKILEACLSEKDKKELMSYGGGKKRLEKLNNFIKKSPPLKPWTARKCDETKSRLDVELTTRRVLAFLSGGDTVPLLCDILYPREKDVIADKYRDALEKIGSAIKHWKPKQKGQVLNAVKSADFLPDDLRELGWIFSTNLWNSCFTSARGPLHQQFRSKLKPVPESEHETGLNRNTRPRITAYVSTDEDSEDERNPYLPSLIR
ncbi:uncharacterized protein LOC111697280 isoform X2 [Eurytemora carolleeae]|uniref:uncharacterized protein LOC111697280 isoform X2 n=1 Tax=Eurytemora carolleeae TaxID=1294199 RepID=UPI000C782E9E|nr:uncharacterized protein LOC111697280 isoform X2 [Eurytemora carolleeae]|eukprot:XP_023322984.1 uncharacterized protein LOC111697280 isoform X2 [Eurytemora affinis]